MRRPDPALGHTLELRGKRSSSRVLVLSFGLASLQASSAHASSAEEAASVVELRIEVDVLAAEVRDERAQTQARLAGLQQERDQLERRLRAARLRSSTLDQIVRERAALEAAHDAEADRWQTPAQQAVAWVRAAVEGGLPFMLEERRAVLDRIDAELAGHQPDVARAMERLWRFLEEEAAMTSEVALHRQSIAIAGSDGTPQLVDVLRIGMAVLYFRTFQGDVGWARREGAGWVFEPLPEPGSATVRTLFDAHENNEGYGPAVLWLPSRLENAER